MGYAERKKREKREKREKEKAMGIQDNRESFTADELRMLQGVLNCDRKTLDYLEGVVDGLDLTDRRATAGVLVLKVRRMLERLLSDELEERKRQLEETQRLAQEKEAQRAPGLALVEGKGD